MARCRRSDIIDHDEVGIYHCFTRCVRSSYLCGFDAETGRCFNHRKRWIIDRVRELSAIFVIDAAVYGVMENHYHLILRNRPDIGAALDDEEVVRRWRALYPRKRDEKGKAIAPTEAELRLEMGDKERVAEWRARLSNISWFMKSLNEYISVNANREDGVKGHFWESRFKCQRLLDEIAVLACGLYVDLNEIRARLALSPEESLYVSACVRIAGCQARQDARKKGEASTAMEPARPSDPDYWLCPLNESVELPCLTPHGGPAKLSAPAGRRLTRQGLIGLSLDCYLELLDMEGRRLRGDKSGQIPAPLAPILERLGLSVEAWSQGIDNFGARFGHVVGTSARVEEYARKHGRRWYRGVGDCRKFFG